MCGSVGTLKKSSNKFTNMGVFTKILFASVCVAFLAVKWTAPRFDAGKSLSLAVIVAQSACNPDSSVEHLLWKLWLL